MTEQRWVGNGGCKLEIRVSKIRLLKGKVLSPEIFRSSNTENTDDMDWTNDYRYFV